MDGRVVVSTGQAALLGPCRGVGRGLIGPLVDPSLSASGWLICPSESHDSLACANCAGMAKPPAVAAGAAVVVVEAIASNNCGCGREREDDQERSEGMRRGERRRMVGGKREETRGRYMEEKERERKRGERKGREVLKRSSN